MKNNLPMYLYDKMTQYPVEITTKWRIIYYRSTRVKVTKCNPEFLSMITDILPALNSVTSGS